MLIINAPISTKQRYRFTQYKYLSCILTEKPFNIRFVKLSSFHFDYESINGIRFEAK